jgi:hypothetical protein
MQEHYCLAEGVSEDKASIVFNNAACKVIKDTFKHVRCISVASYYTQVNVLLFCMQGLRVVLRRHSRVKRLQTSQASIYHTPTI